VEAAVASKINEYRAGQGLRALVRHPGLDALAREHAADMRRSGRMSHAGFAKRGWVAERDLGLPRVAENVMWGKGAHEAGLPDRIVQGWIGSRGHRRNLLAKHEYIGVGVVRGGDGSFWATQLSGTR
jgi:uncharacterized protein YkwD